jgi:hypothetical protein
LLGRNQKAQNRPPVRFRNDVKYRFHSSDILQPVYTCQGI